MKTLFEKTTTSLAMELKKASTIDEIQHVINTYMHDYRTGLPRGMPGPMICLTTKEDAEARPEASNANKAKEDEDKVAPTDNIVNVVKGNKN